MSKDTPQRAKARAAKVAKREKKRRTVAIDKAVKALKSKPTLAKNFADNKDNIGYAFWVAHGLNYLASDYEQGVWSPLYPEVYTGTVVSANTIFTRVLNRFLGPDKHLSEAGIKCVLWASLRPEELFKLVWRTRQYTRLHGGEPHQALDPHTWTFVQMTGNLMRKSCKSWDLYRDQVWDLEGLFDNMARATLEDLSSVGVDEEDTRASRGCLPTT